MFHLDAVWYVKSHNNQHDEIAKRNCRRRKCKLFFKKNAVCERLKMLEHASNIIKRSKNDLFIPEKSQ